MIRTLIIAWSVLGLILPVRAEVKVSAEFPGGSVKVESMNAGSRVLRFKPAAHQNRGWDCWWYFKVSGLEPGVEWTFDLGGTGFAAPRQAAFSTNNRDWKQTAPGRREGGRIRYTLKSPGETLWLAWGPPFGLADANALVKQVAGAKVGADRFELCKSRDGHAVPALRWEPLLAGKRPAIWIQARQHAWESGGSWVCSGLVEWLASKEGAALRTRARIFVVPIMDVDNVQRGAGGKNQIPHDHNRDWSDQPHWPEVAAAQRWIQRLNRDDDFVLFLDLHNPAPGDTRPFYFGSPKSHLNPGRMANQVRFHQLSQQIMGKEPFGLSDKIRVSGPGYHPLWRHISKNWVAEHTAAGSVNLTLETSWNTPHSTQPGYRAYGAALGRTIAAFVLKPGGQ